MKPLYAWLRAVFADSIYNRLAALLACFLAAATESHPRPQRRWRVPLAILAEAQLSALFSPQAPRNGRYGMGWARD